MTVTYVDSDFSNVFWKVLQRHFDETWTEDIEEIQLMQIRRSLDH